MHVMRRNREPSAVAIILIFFFTFLLAPGVSASAATWTVTNLRPAMSPESYAYAVSGGQQVGYAIVVGRAQASLWSGTAASWTNLNPPGAYESYIYGVNGGKQVGWADMGS